MPSSSTMPHLKERKRDRPEEPRNGAEAGAAAIRDPPLTFRITQRIPQKDTVTEVLFEEGVLQARAPL